MWPWWCHASNKKEMSREIITILVTVFASIWFLCIFRKLRKDNVQLPPGPRGLPIVGYLPFLGNNLHHEFTKLAQIYGPIYKLWLGNKLCVVINSSSLMKEVVRDQDKIFGNRDTPVATLISTYGGTDIVFSPYGPYWKKMRKTFVHEILSNACLDSCYALRREEVQKTIRQVYNENIGMAIDIGELAFLTVTNSVMSMMFGETIQGETHVVGPEFRKVIAEHMVVLAKPNVTDLFSVLAWFDVQGMERQAKEILQSYDKIFNSAVELHTSSVAAKGVGGNEQTKGFLQVLLELRDHGDSDSKITITQIKAMLMDIMVGGTDIIASTVEWVMAKLMQHPKVMEKVHEELTKVVGLYNMVEELHSPKLHTLDAVVKETLRLHPVVPLLVPRCPSASCTVGGYTIPKGTAVHINVGAMHKDPNLWDNPLEFRPERFLNDPNLFDYHGNNLQYLPFGSGRRICAGIPLAQKMLMHVVASLLHCFKWELPPGQVVDYSDEFGLVIKKKNPLVAIPTPRLSKLELYE
ncbi:p450 domain-containing protein [Cephalotus follicularis]|uniref:p450 domain-containing protein n=1 Tax=Cephalotus follicularis TaxID=3775 RepID=A0A1Q3CHU9_CEPFO|nr:p450 domain-containing protein [Cephalotus follicularis]